MKIFDDEFLHQDNNILLNIIRNHPLNPKLPENIEFIIIKEIVVNPNKSQSENIQFDQHNKMVTLNIFRDSPKNPRFEFILYHEFGHIADRINQHFGYSEEKNEALAKKEKYYVMELWNLYIDSRLNKFGLGGIKPLGWGRMKHSQDIIKKIWENPDYILSYDDLIMIVRENITNDYVLLKPLHILS